LNILHVWLENAHLMCFWGKNGEMDLLSAFVSI